MGRIPAIECDGLDTAKTSHPVAATSPQPPG